MAAAKNHLVETGERDSRGEHLFQIGGTKLPQSECARLGIIPSDWRPSVSEVALDRRWRQSVNDALTTPL